MMTSRRHIGKVMVRPRKHWTVSFPASRASLTLTVRCILIIIYVYVYGVLCVLISLPYDLGVVHKAKKSRIDSQIFIRKSMKFYYNIYILTQIIVP